MTSGQSLEVRLRAVEFLLAHLISKTRTSTDLTADRVELQDIVDRGEAWKLMIDVPRELARETVQTAVDLLEEAEFQQGVE